MFRGIAGAEPATAPKVSDRRVAASGVDYAYGRLTPAELHGYEFVCRYLSPEPAKNLTETEALELHAGGISIVLVWEDTATAALGGKDAGIIQARAALEQANALKVPPNVPIYFAVDFDPKSSQLTAIENYFAGVAAILGRSRVGVYGGYHVVRAVLALQRASFAWQTLAWSAGELHPEAHIYQSSNGHKIAGVDVDLDEALREPYGAWKPTPAAARRPPVPPTVKPAQTKFSFLVVFDTETHKLTVK